MKKLLMLCCLFSFLFVQNIASQTLGNLFVEPNGVFSISMPNGWQMVDINMAYMMIMGPEYNGFTPNINFADEDYSGAISDYLDAVMGFFPLLFSDFRLLGRSVFQTNTGLTGECITYLVTMGQIQVRQKMYVFPNSKRTAVMVITGTAPVVSGETYDVVFDTSVSTFKWVN